MVAALVEYLLAEVPLTAAMKLQAGMVSDAGISVKAPLSPNHNDKGTAFGGTLATLCTLSGWAMTSNICQQADCDIDIVIIESNVRYLRPVIEDSIEATAFWPEQNLQQAFIKELREKHWSRLRVSATVSSTGLDAVHFSGLYGARLLDR